MSLHRCARPGLFPFLFIINRNRSENKYKENHNTEILELLYMGIFKTNLYSYLISNYYLG